MDFTCGISDDEMTRRFKEAIRLDEEKRDIQGIPQPKYDGKNNKAYLLYPDGRIEYV